MLMNSQNAHLPTSMAFRTNGSIHCRSRKSPAARCRGIRKGDCESNWRKPVASRGAVWLVVFWGIPWRVRRSRLRILTEDPGAVRADSSKALLYIGGQSSQTPMPDGSQRGSGGRDVDSILKRRIVLFSGPETHGPSGICPLRAQERKDNYGNQTIPPFCFLAVNRSRPTGAWGRFVRRTARMVPRTIGGHTVQRRSDCRDLRSG